LDFAGQHGPFGAVKAVLWLCDIAERPKVAQTLKTVLGDWCADALPAGIKLTWVTSPDLD